MVISHPTDSQSVSKVVASIKVNIYLLKFNQGYFNRELCAILSDIVADVCCRNYQKTWAKVTAI